MQMWPPIFWRIVQSLRGRFSGHRTGMKSPFVQNNSICTTFCCQSLQKCELHIKITDKLSESGRDDNGIPILRITIERWKKETKWMLTLQPVFSYGVNDKVGDEYMVETDLAMTSYHYIVYTSFQIIITLKLSLIILS